MKKTLKLFTVITCIALVLALSSCGFWNKEQNDQVTTTTEPPHEHIFANADCLNPKTCECGATDGEALGHTPNNDDGDCTTAVTCSECGVVTTEARNEHTGGTATCGAKAVCESCGTAYGEIDLDNHVVIDGSCACGEIWHIDATEMTPEQLNAAVAEKLAAGETDIEIILAPDAPAEMFTAIRRALIDTEGVEDGSINLTLKGVTAIPDHSNDTDKYTLIFGVAYNDENGEFFDEEECVCQLASINLPDVLTIGERSFSHCENLTAIIAPKAQMIDEWAFAYTGLLSVDLPEVTTIKYAAFIACEYITEFKLPKAAFLGDQALDMIISESEVTFYLTNESDIVIDKDLWYGLNLEEEMIASANLVLHVNKQHQVNGNTWTAKDADGNEVSFTFKSITFICSDGTTNHDYQYSDNGDGTHNEVCSKCAYVKVDNEKHTAVPDGYDCICGATVIAVIDGTLGGKSVATDEDINALVEQLKAYVDNGITTIIVTGENPAIIDMGYYTNTAIGEAIYRLSGSDYYDENNPYNGKIDLILQDVTEIVDQEFYSAWVLNSITLPKVIKMGDEAFHGTWLLKTITFGSVLTEANEADGVMFAQVGKKVGGCDLILNCGQMNESSVPAPDLTANTWKFKFANEFKSITLTHTGECDECKANQ